MSFAGRLSHAIARVHRRTRPARQPLTLSQLSALGSLARHGPMRVGDLAVAEMVAPPVATRLVTALELAGHVERCASPVDRRACLVRLTPQGVAQLDTAREQRAAIMRERLTRLSPADRQALERALAALEALGAD